MKKVFVTGIGGCVGHYLFDALVGNPDFQLNLLVRNPDKLKFIPKNFPQVNIIQGDLKHISQCANLLKEMDYVVHLAANWGGSEENYDYTLELFNRLDPALCRKVIYFSTASILGENNQPLPAAEKFGTHYIRSKYRLFKELPGLKIYPKVITLFPTWVLGGDKNHPYSHATAGILEMRSWLRLIRFFTVDASFHFIHARDIAQITKYLLENEVKEREFVLGNAPTTASELIQGICAYCKIPVYFQIPISFPLIQFFAFVTGHKLHPWDIYCMEKRRFVYQAVNADSFKLKSGLKTIQGVLADATK